MNELCSLGLTKLNSKFGVDVYYIEDLTTFYVLTPPRYEANCEIKEFLGCARSWETYQMYQASGTVVLDFNQLSNKEASGQ